MIASDGNNYFDGGACNDEIAAGSGMDVFIGGAGDDMIDGGDGFDKAKYVGSYYDFTIEKQLDSFSVKTDYPWKNRHSYNVERLNLLMERWHLIQMKCWSGLQIISGGIERTPDPVELDIM